MNGILMSTGARRAIMFGAISMAASCSDPTSIEPPVVPQGTFVLYKMGYETVPTVTLDDPTRQVTFVADTIVLDANGVGTRQRTIEVLLKSPGAQPVRNTSSSPIRIEVSGNRLRSREAVVCAANTESCLELWNQPARTATLRLFIGEREYVKLGAATFAGGAESP